MRQSDDPGVEQAWVTEAGGGSHGVSKADLPAPAEHLSQLVSLRRCRYEVDWDNPDVLTDGFRLYVRIARGLYHEVDRRGRRKGAICSGFEPRPRWRPARRCTYDIATDGLTCPRCGACDMQYAESGVRSYCLKQGRYRVG